MRVTATRPVVFAVTSDHHVGSTVGLCCPEKVGLPDGGFHEPAPIQQRIWERYEDYWSVVRARRAAVDGQLYVVLNGDLFEGDHHGTWQIVSKHPEAADYISDRAFGALSPVAISKPDRVFIVRGTEAHSKPLGASEEQFARRIGATADEITTTRPIWSWWRLRMTIHNCVLDFMHHPGTYGSRPWTEASGAARLAHYIWAEHSRRKIRAPDVAVRSHVHNPNQGWSDGVHAIITPAWQLKTGHAWKVVSEKITPFGGVIIIVYPDGQHTVEFVTYEPEIQEWSPSLSTPSSMPSASTTIPTAPTETGG
jgi:hypothetical protein